MTREVVLTMMPVLFAWGSCDIHEGDTRHIDHVIGSVLFSLVSNGVGRGIYCVG